MRSKTWDNDFLREKKPKSTLPSVQLHCLFLLKCKLRFTFRFSLYLFNNAYNLELLHPMRKYKPGCANFSATNANIFT